MRCQLVVARHVAEIDRVRRDWFDVRDAVEPRTREDLIARMKDGLVTVLDVRPADEASVARLLGAINVPLAELEARLGELDRDREIVAYCRGPWCVLAFDAVAILGEKGFKALAARRRFAALARRRVAC